MMTDIFCYRTHTSLYFIQSSHNYPSYNESEDEGRSKRVMKVQSSFPVLIGDEEKCAVQFINRAPKGCLFLHQRFNWTVPLLTVDSFHEMFHLLL